MPGELMEFIWADGHLARPTHNARGLVISSALFMRRVRPCTRECELHVACRVFTRAQCSFVRTGGDRKRTRGRTKNAVRAFARDGGASAFCGVCVHVYLALAKW